MGLAIDDEVLVEGAMSVEAYSAYEVALLADIVVTGKGNGNAAPLGMVAPYHEKVTDTTLDAYWDPEDRMTNEAAGTDAETNGEVVVLT